MRHYVRVLALMLSAGTIIPAIRLLPLTTGCNKRLISSVTFNLSFRRAAINATGPGGSRARCGWLTRRWR